MESHDDYYTQLEPRAKIGGQIHVWGNVKKNCTRKMICRFGGNDSESEGSLSLSWLLNSSS